MHENEKNIELDLVGLAAPPRSNGELLFQEPWEARTFGMLMTLYENGLFEWKEFQLRLITEIKRWEETALPDEEYQYYERWIAAFQNLLKDKGLCEIEEIETRTKNFAKRPHGHDHLR